MLGKGAKGEMFGAHSGLCPCRTLSKSHHRSGWLCSGPEQQLYSKNRMFYIELNMSAKELLCGLLDDMTCKGSVLGV